KVGGDGSASNGWWIVNGGAKDINDTSQFNDPFIAWARNLLTSHGIDPKSSGSLGSGFWLRLADGPSAHGRWPDEWGLDPQQPDGQRGCAARASSMLPACFQQGPRSTSALSD